MRFLQAPIDNSNGGGNNTKGNQCSNCPNGCCYQDTRCGSSDECSKNSMTFVIVLVSIIVLLVIILVTWCYFIHRRNVNQKNRILQKMMECEIRHQTAIRKHGIVFGVVIPKNIPMKEAAVRSSYDLEHLKSQGINFFDKGSSKKIYMELYQKIKGEDQIMKNGKYPGPQAAPGQKIKIHDFSQGRMPQEYAKQIQNSPYLKSNMKIKASDIEKTLRDVDQQVSAKDSKNRYQQDSRKHKSTSSNNPQQVQRQNGPPQQQIYNELQTNRDQQVVQQIDQQRLNQQLQLHLQQQQQQKAKNKASDNNQIRKQVTLRTTRAEEVERLARELQELE
eukprot:403363026